MSHHLLNEEIERYRRREMAPAELLAADDHLCSCEACYGRFEGGVPLSVAYRFAESLIDTKDYDHLTDDELVAYLEGDPSVRDQKRKQIHFETCLQCKTDLADLALIKSSLTPGRTFRPRRSRRVIGRIAMHWQSRGVRASVQIAGVTVLMIIAAALATYPIRSELSRTAALIEDQRGSIDAMKSRLAELSQGPGSPPWILLSLVDGNTTVALDRQGNLSGLKSVSPATGRLVRDALTRGYFTIPGVLAKLRGSAPLVMGGTTGTEPYSLLSPVAIVVESRSPTFQWQPLDGATGYIVSVYDNRLNKVAGSERITATEWMGAQLKPGVIYTWQVKAFKDGHTIKLPLGHQPDAEFQVLDKSKASAIEDARNRYAGSHLILAALYADAGLIADAERELQQLEQANPASPIADQFLEQVRSLKPK